MPQTSHQTMRSVSQERCFICTMCSMRMWEITNVKPLTRKEKTGIRLGCMWSVSDFTALDIRL